MKSKKRSGPRSNFSNEQLDLGPICFPRQGRVSRGRKIGLSRNHNITLRSAAFQFNLYCSIWENRVLKRLSFSLRMRITLGGDKNAIIKAKCLNSIGRHDQDLYLPATPSNPLYVDKIYFNPLSANHNKFVCFWRLLKCLSSFLTNSVDMDGIPV